MEICVCWQHKYFILPYMEKWSVLIYSVVCETVTEQMALHGSPTALKFSWSVQPMHWSNDRVTGKWCHNIIIKTQ